MPYGKARGSPKVRTPFWGEYGLRWQELGVARGTHVGYLFLVPWILGLGPCPFCRHLLCFPSHSL